MSSDQTFRVLIVEDEAIIARDLGRIVELAGQTVLARAASADLALEIVVRQPPDLALVDIRIGGGMDGVDCARRLWRDFMVPVIFVTAHTEDEIVRRAAQPGVLGFIVKPFQERQLLTTLKLARVRSEAERLLWRDSWHYSAMADAFSRIADEIDITRRRLKLEKPPQASHAEAFSAALMQLTAREREVLRLLMNNHRVAAIAHTLFISQHTVRNHLKSVYRKLGVGSQAALIERVRQTANPLV